MERRKAKRKPITYPLLKQLFKLLKKLPVVLGVVFTAQLIQLLFFGLLIAPFVRLFQSGKLFTHEIFWQKIVYFYLVFALLLFIRHLIHFLFEGINLHYTYAYFQGKKASLRTAIRQTLKSYRYLYVWGNYAGLVGMFLIFLPPKAQRHRRVAQLLQGLSWRNACYFAFHWVLFKHASPKQALTESAQLIKNTWGQVKRQNHGIFGIFFAIRVIILILGLQGTQHPVDNIRWFCMGCTGTAIWIATVICTACYWLIYSMSYLYATDSETFSRSFDANLLKNLFR